MWDCVAPAGGGEVGYARGMSSKETRPVAGAVRVRVGSRFMNAGAMVGLALERPLIGRMVLGAVDLVAECAKRAVGPRAESPARPLRKLKQAFAHAPRHADTTERGLLDIAGEAGRRRLGGGAACVRGLRCRPCRRRRQPGCGRMAVGGDAVMAAGQDARSLPAPARPGHSTMQGTPTPALGELAP